MARLVSYAEAVAAARCRSQGSGNVLAASKPSAPRATPPKRIGALTGLELPMHAAKPRKVADPRPDSRPSPLPPGLPNTPIEACKMLMLAIVIQALQDNDLRYVLSPMFEHDLMCAGLEAEEAFKIKIAYLRGQVDLRRLDGTQFHAHRQVTP